MRPLRPGPLLALCLLHCSPGPSDTTTGTTTTNPDPQTTGTGASTAAEPTSTGTGTPSTTGGAAPCTSSFECPEGGHCVLIPCSLSQEPGCDEYHCSAACSSPLDETAAYKCVDDPGCCDDAVCVDEACTPPNPPATTGGSTGEGSTGDTDGLLPCAASSDCPGEQNCLLKPCDVVDEPGCGEFHCYPECSDPFTDTAFWTCADSDACCGFDCIDGMCTEVIGSTG